MRDHGKGKSRAPALERRTCAASYTDTSEGRVSHLLCSVGGQTFRAPVKLDFLFGADARGRYAPLYRDGRLVFALPGGREVRA